MDWMPKKWIAGLLGFFLQPLGFLYVARPGWALFYFCVGLALNVAEYTLGLEQDALLGFLLFNALCAGHAMFFADHYQARSLRPWYSRWYGLAAFPIGLLLAITSFRAFLFEPFRIPSASMSPTLVTGDHVLASKWGYGNYGSYGFDLPYMGLGNALQRGDVVVFKFPRDPSVLYIQRIIGLPGDRLTVDGKAVYLNGEKVDQTFVKSHVQYEQDYDVYSETLGDVSYQVQFNHNAPNPGVSGDYVVPEGHVFVLGDNRKQSSDSRFWGPVPIANITAKLVHVF